MKFVYRAVAVVGVAIVLLSSALALIYHAYRRPYREVVSDFRVAPALVYAVMKAESGFREGAVSRVGAVGLMQILPSTAEYICRRRQIEFCGEHLLDGEYNTKLGCMYLEYLLEQFSDEYVAICAYNAGEGTVAKWLKDEACSKDGRTLYFVPYSETRDYVKKVCNFKKNYLILYH